MASCDVDVTPRPGLRRAGGGAVAARGLPVAAAEGPVEGVFGGVPDPAGNCADGRVGGAQVVRCELQPPAGQVVGGAGADVIGEAAVERGAADAGGAGEVLGAPGAGRV